MNYLGKWIFHSIGTFGEDGIVYLNAQEYLDSPMPYVDENDTDAIEEELQERRKMIAAQVRICEDGQLYLLMPLPENVTKEEVDAAVAQGEICLYDGMMCQQPMKWEERNGQLWYDTGIEGEILGEAADSWVNAIDEEGYLSLINIRFVEK